MCEICQHWARAGAEACINGNLTTDHHANCPRYNDSLMDVYKVTVDGFGACYVEDLEVAKDTAGEDEEKATIEAIKMHREIFENLPEFDGF